MGNLFNHSAYWNYCLFGVLMFCNFFLLFYIFTCFFVTFMFISISQFFIYIKIGIPCLFKYILCSWECKVLMKMKIRQKKHIVMVQQATHKKKASQWILGVELKEVKQALVIRQPHTFSNFFLLNIFFRITC